MRQTRRTLWRAWDAHGWAALVVAVVVVTAAGVVGFSSYDAAQPLSNRLYLTVQLFTLNSGGLDGEVPWLLELARWGAPVVTALAAAEAVIRILRSRSAGWRARLMKGHLVVVGLGDRGWRVVQRAVDDQTPVAVVEVDPTNPRVNSARRLGVPVVVGDAGDLDRLLAAGLRGADRLVCLSGRPATNAAVAQTLLAARHLCRDDFTSFVEIPDPTVMRELQGLVDEGWVGPRQEFFNLEDRAGAVILGRHDPVEFGVRPRPRPVVVVGAGDAGLSVLGAAASRWEAAGRDLDGASGVLCLRLLVPDTEDVLLASRRVSLLHPDFHPGDGDTVPRTSQLQVDPVDTWRPGPTLEAALAGLPEEPALVVVSTTDEAVTLRMTSVLLRLLEGTSVPVVVTAPDRTGPVSLLARHPATREPGVPSRAGGVHLFAVNDELCTDALIRQGRIDALARAIHDGYLRHLLPTSATPTQPAQEHPALVSWEALPAGLKEQNVAAALAMWEMLHAEGFTVVARESRAAATREFSDAAVDRMAAREHRRWFAGKYPDLPAQNWTDLDLRHREQSRDQVRRFPATLAVAGLQVSDPQHTGLFAPADQPAGYPADY